MMMIHCHRDHDDDKTMPRPVIHLQPNVIARLMGMDDDAIIVPTPPPPPNPAAVHVQFVQAQRRRRLTNKFSLHLPYYSSYSYRGRGGNHDDDDDAEYSSPSSRLCLNTTTRVPGSGWRPRPRRWRRHPQEEELLQKVRQDLQAWQASKAPPALLLQTSTSSCTRLSLDSDYGSRSSLVLQAIAQEDLRKQKMARYGLGLGLGQGPQGKVTQQEEFSLIKNNKSAVAVPQGVTSEHASEPVAMPHARDLQPCKDGHGHGHGHGAPAAQAQELPSAHGHTPIVILKPVTTCSQSEITSTTGGVAIGGAQKTSVFLGLPKLHRDANMSVLLQEVKNRVQRELTVTAATATGGGLGELIKTKQQAPVSAPPLQQVTKEDQCGNKRRLFRSESFRAFRRDRKRNASPEAYIVKSEMTVSPNKADDEESVADPSLSVLRPGGVIGVTDGQSFRSECLNLTKHRDEHDATASSPRLLFRSFSAPEPGLAFSLGRLFSFKQHQASEPADAMASKSVVSAGFSSFIRGTVSSLRRHGFSSRRNLIMFRRKTHWSWSNKTSLRAGEIHPAKMEVPICAATTPPPSHETFNLFKVAQASLSELPPSPVSPLEVAAGHSSHHFFTLPPELSPKCLSEFEAPATTSESSFRTDITAVETACSRDKAYITELLIAAGLYDDDDGPSSANARVDSMARPMPICDDVFEDVEDMYYYRGDYVGSGGGISGGDGTDHRMLFDLANEALQSLVVESSSSRGGSSLRQWVVDSTGVSRGKKLVDDVWHKMQTLRNNPQAQEMQTIEGMAAYEVRRSVWTEVLLYEDVYVIGRKIERAIFDELIQDLFASLEVFI